MSKKAAKAELRSSLAAHVVLCRDRQTSGRRRSHGGYHLHEGPRRRGGGRYRYGNAIERAGGKANAADADAVKAAIEKTVATFGELDVLVNNAGTAIPRKFEEATLEKLDRVIDINVRSTFLPT